MKLLRNRSKKVIYTRFQKYLATNLMLGTSINGYKFLSTLLPLPCSETVSRVIRQLNTKPGIATGDANKLRIKVHPREEKDKYVFILMDEMSLRKGLTYDKASDTLIGFQDLGLERCDKLATSAFCVMAVGIVKKWKYPLGYFLTSSTMQAADIMKVVRNSINVMEEQGFKVLGITSDQGSNMEKAFKLLGASENKPYISIANNNYYVIRDPPHLLKSARNFLLSRPVNVPGFDVPANWSHIKQVYEEDLQRSHRLAHKLTENHVSNVRFGTKMKVSIAANVLSNSVAAAIDYMVASGALESACLATSTYAKKINDLFDCFNSISFFDHCPLRKPLIKGSISEDFLR